MSGLASAQKSPAIRRIGHLVSGDPSAVHELRPDDALSELGWVEGRNLHVERRMGPIDALDKLAEDLVRAKVELIVAMGTPETLAARRATSTIPIVFSVGDPIAIGIVDNLARPGGNATGLSFASPETDVKQLAVLKELLPWLARLGVVVPADHAYFVATRPRFEEACRALGIEPVFVELRQPAEIDGAMARLAGQRVQAVLLRGSSFVQHHAVQLTSAAHGHSLPTMAEQPDVAREANALISYTGTLPENERRRASYVDRILRGAKPGDLPIEQPTQFEMVINLKTARALNVAVPKALLSRADEVIR